MSQEQTAGQSSSNAGKQPGKPLVRDDYIPQAVRDNITGKMPEGGEVKSARENGSYKGPVIYTDDRYIGQSVGKEGKTAVLHLKKDVEMVGSNLKFRVENNVLNKAEIQVHYNGDKGKAYPFNSEREQQKQQDGKAAGTKEQGEKPKRMTQEQMLAKARDYAAKEIKNPKSREAFLKHLEQSVAQPEKAKQVSVAQPEKTKDASGRQDSAKEIGFEREL